MAAIRRIARASLVALLLNVPLAASADGQLRSVGLPGIDGLASLPPSLRRNAEYVHISPKIPDRPASRKDRHYEWGPLSVDVAPTERKSTVYADAFDAGTSFGSPRSRRAIEIRWRNN